MKAKGKAEIIYDRFLKTAKYLLQELEYYGENQFKQRVSENQFTIGEYYDFLINSNISFYIPQIQKCLLSSAGSAEADKNIKGKFVFWYGRIPAIMKYPDISQYKPVQPESPEKMKDNLYRFIKIMNKTAQEIDASESKSKVLHPYFGMLDALEWYSLIEMNFKHLLKEKITIDRVLRSASFDEVVLADKEEKIENI